ncbi:MAG: hypothetical protein D4R68_04600 [Ignavibacteriales bacterium]|nr:MAG: hypothetical protein D4R68_04600 [Ignavibacteriales bacterium]
MSTFDILPIFWIDLITNFTIPFSKAISIYKKIRFYFYQIYLYNLPFLSLILMYKICPLLE